MHSKLLKLIICVAATLLWGGVTWAQTRTVKGHVIASDDNQPVAGAFVTPEGYPKIGTTTDLDGNFVLDKVPSGAKNIIISFMG